MSKITEAEWTARATAALAGENDLSRIFGRSPDAIPRVVALFKARWQQKEEERRMQALALAEQRFLRSERDKFLQQQRFEGMLDALIAIPDTQIPDAQ